jgi:hypothetical protein
MPRFITAVVITLLLAVPATANEKIESVISAQIDAFLADDVERAFTYASPTIRRMFGTPERFGEMVRNGYPMVWRPEEVEFLSVEQRARGLSQTVMIRDGAGALHILEYQMVQQEGRWLINGVRLRKAPAGTA